MQKCPKCKKKTLEDEDVFNCVSKENGDYICQSCGDEEDAKGLIREVY